MTVDLNPFLHRSRNDLMLPMTCDGGSVACNGHIAVWADVPCENPMPEKVSVLPETIRIARNSIRDGEWRRADAIEVTKEKCFDCEGSGKLIVEDCEDCDDGWFDHGSHEYECKACDGSGAIETPARAEDTLAPRCETCVGTGLRRDEVPSNILYANGTRAPNSMYIRLLQALPNCEVRTDSLVSCAPPTASESGVILFRFDGGFGVLMPVLVLG